MALPPPPRPEKKALTPEQAAAEQLARDVAAAKVLEQHVDLWIKGQGPNFLQALHEHPDRVVEVSIGDHGRVSEGVRVELEKLYRGAGWGLATTVEDPADPRGVVLRLALEAPAHAAEAAEGA